MSSFTFGFNVKPRKAGGVSYDADALAYFNANTSITSTADKNAINDFYLGLKSDGIYTKIKAMYLPIWGSAASSKWNLVNPVDTDAAFRLTFATGVTYTSSGMTGNGTSGYANTFLNPKSNLSNFNSHYSAYSRTSNATNLCDMGCIDYYGVSGYEYSLYIKYSNETYFHIQPNTNCKFSDTDAKGFYIGSRSSNTVLKGYKNGILKVTQTTTAIGTLPDVNAVLLAQNNRSAGNVISQQLYSNREYSFYSMGNSLTDTEAANFYTRVQTLMTYFGINV